MTIVYANIWSTIVKKNIQKRIQITIISLKYNFDV